MAAFEVCLLAPESSSFLKWKHSEMWAQTSDGKSKAAPTKKAIYYEKNRHHKKGHSSKMEGPLFVFLKRKTFIKKPPRRHALAPESLTTLT